MNMLFRLFCGEQIKHVITILNWQVIAYIRKIWRFWNDMPATKKLFMISAKCMQTVTAWVNMIGIRFSNKIYFAWIRYRINYWTQETFKYNSHRLSCSEWYERVGYICEKYTMKSTLPIEGELCSCSKCRWVRYVCPILSFWMIILISISTR